MSVLLNPCSFISPSETLQINDLQTSKFLFKATKLKDNSQFAFVSVICDYAFSTTSFNS